MIFLYCFLLTSPLSLCLSIWASSSFFSHFLESENSTSLNTSSTGKLVMTSNFVNAMPWCMDTMLPTTVISGSAEGPNETGQKSLSFQSLVPGFVFPCSSITELYRNIQIA